MSADKTTVSIVKGNHHPAEKEVEAMVRKSLDQLGDLSDLIGPGKKVLIKPNVAEISCIRADVTDLRVTRALAKIAKEKGAQVIIAESGSVAQDTEKLFEMTSYDDLREEGWELVDLHKTEEIKVPLPHPRKGLKELKVYKLLLNVDTVISVPVLKTHMALLVTLAIKNMKGGIPDTEKRKFHLKYGVEEAIAQLSTVIPPHLSVVDGIWAGAGSMSPYRLLEEMDLIIAGRDPVAVDATCSRIMGIDPETVLHIKYAEELGAGTLDTEKIEVVGKQVEEVSKRFVLPSERRPELREDLDINIVMDDKTCTACRVKIFSTLGLIEDIGKGETLQGLTIVSGPDMEMPPDVPKEDLILVGNCTAKFKDRGRHIEGCPIWSKEMVYEITGLEIPETYMGDHLDEGYEIYKKEVAEGASPGFDWENPPDEQEMKRYTS
ncbi:MAG: DUF362 domain-containing protein [Deltaproteobacteria bacterium]|nr:DUF362 domain-containing protein [Deltaproteobacteria bacterium]MBW2140662.1 DUF362 domain-containing protein [Deltaproteobacteria bacterium]